jgi:hypothetical protein
MFSYFSNKNYVSIMTGCGLHFLAGAGIFTTMPKLVPGPTQLPVQWIPWVVSSGKVAGA